MTLTPMTPAEQAELIEYARRFGYRVGNRHGRFCDEIVSASLLGAAIAFASEDFPGDVEGRRKFLGQACWNMIRRELTACTKEQPILFTDLAAGPAEPNGSMSGFAGGGDDPRHAERDVDWADEFEHLAAGFVGVTLEVFRLAYGPVEMSQSEIGRRVGRSRPVVKYHLDKIARGARGRYEREDDLG